MSLPIPALDLASMAAAFGPLLAAAPIEGGEGAGLAAAAIAVSVGVLFCLAGLACLALSILGMPGVWILIALAVGIDLIDGWWLEASQRPTFSIGVLVAAVLLAAAGELVEFLASAVGASRGGASRRGIVGSLLGALFGALAGTLLIPVPVVGTLAGAVAGSFLGAVLGELAAGRTARGSIRPATGAAIGRVLGTLGKLPFAISVWAILCVAAFA
jgi:uncharacterized protein YqgC (DUF456 family)